MKQDILRTEDGTLNFLFLVKFYPEDIEDELIQVVRKIEIHVTSEKRYRDAPESMIVLQKDWLKTR